MYLNFPFPMQLSEKGNCSSQQISCPKFVDYSIFKFSADVRTVIYTTNAIESLNSTYRKLDRQRSVFPSAQALQKALYLATLEATKKWTMLLIYNQN